MSQPTGHIFHHIAAEEPRIGEVEVAFREHLLICWNENHLGVEVGADGDVVIQESPCWTRYNQNTVAGIVVFGHAQMKFERNGIG